MILKSINISAINPEAAVQSINLFLQCLLFINPDIGLAPDIQTEHCFLVVSNSCLRPFNRVFQYDMPTDSEVEDIKDIWKEVPFTWPVNSNDAQTIALLEKHGLTRYQISFPVMQLDLITHRAQCHSKEHTIRTVQDADVLLEDWLAIVASVFNYPVDELSKVICQFKCKIPGSLKLYLGYYNNQVAAACMAIHHETVVTIYSVSVLPTYRHKGCGSVIIQQALLDAQKNKCAYALLFASPAGLSLAKHIGFKESALYHMYGNYN